MKLRLKKKYYKKHIENWREIYEARLQSESIENSEVVDAELDAIKANMPLLDYVIKNRPDICAKLDIPVMKKKYKFKSEAVCF